MSSIVHQIPIKHSEEVKNSTLYQQPSPPPQQQPPPYGQPPQGQNPWGQPPPGYGGPPPQYQYQQSGGGIQGRHIIGGLMMLFGAIVIVMFFVAPWISFDADNIADAVKDVVRDSDAAESIGVTVGDIDSRAFDNFDGCQYTGLQIATRGDGNSDCNEFEDDEGEDDEYEPSSLAPVENSVFAMPVLGFLIGLFGLMLLLNNGSSGGILSISLMVAIVLVAFPLVWSLIHGSIYEQYAENSVTDNDGLSGLSGSNRDFAEYQIEAVTAIVTSGYQVILQSIVPLLTLITVIAGFFVAGGGNKPPQYYPQYGQPMPPYQQQPPPPPPRY